MNLMGLFRSPQNELEKGGIKPGSEETGINNTCPPVSYTHLDVYKRQPQTCFRISPLLRATPGFEKKYSMI